MYKRGTRKLNTTLSRKEVDYENEGQSVLFRGNTFANSVMY